MRGRNGKTLITDRKIREVKRWLENYTPITYRKNPGQLSLYDIADKVKISYSIVWHIWKGHYDKTRPVPKMGKVKGMFDVDELPDWITGWKKPRKTA